MKRFIFILALTAAFISCSKDEEVPTCAVADFVGIWKVEGGEACVLTQTNTLKITDLGSNKIKGVYTGNGVTSQFDSWTVNNCGFTGKISEASFGLDINVVGTLSNGKLTITNKGKFSGLPIDCTETLTK